MAARKYETPTSDQASGVSGEQLSFLPTPAFCPILPPLGSAAVKSLGYLGWEPDSILVQHPEWPNAIARYSLPAKAKQAAAVMRGGDHASH